MAESNNEEGFTSEEIGHITMAAEDLINAIANAAENHGISIRDEHLEGTPMRMARMYAEVFGGLVEDIDDRISVFHSEGSAADSLQQNGTTVDHIMAERYRQGMIVKTRIKYASFCAHHFLPFIGEADIGYIPSSNGILGLSKFARIVEHFARRPQVQERLTDQVADYIWEDVGIEPQGVIVVLRGRHTCESIRGIKSCSNTTTSAVRGIFMEPGVRQEFYSLCQRGDVL